MPVEIGAIMIEDDPDQAVLRNLQAGKEAMSSMAAEQLKVTAAVHQLVTTVVVAAVDITAT